MAASSSMRFPPRRASSGASLLPIRGISRALLVLAVPAGVAAVAVAELHDLRAFRVAMLGLLGLIVAVAILSSDSRRTRVLASALIAGLAALCLTSLSKYGLLPGTALGLSAAVVLGAAFFGGRAAWGITAAATLLILGTGAAVQAGLLRPLSLGTSPDSGDMASWVRFAAVYFLTTSFVSSTVAALIGRLERALRVERESRAVAEQVRVMREEFVAVAAHELRTPLTSLQLAIQTLSRRARHQGGDGAASVERMIDIAEREVESLNALVTSLLDAVKLEEDPVPVAISDVDLADAVRCAVARLREPLRACGSAVTLDVPAGVVGRWDRSRVEQLVTNLLSNAIKYGLGRPITVRVAAEGDVARLAVLDHGMGIAREAQARIFGRFERAVSLRNYGGFGLGLYVVRRIAERLGGTVECTSALGEGSTFVVTLPRRSARARTDMSERSEPDVVGTGESERRHPWLKA
jgi:signal transduction histidine kinase